MAERLVVGISGASGVIYAIRLLQACRERPDVEVHLIMSAAAKQTVVAETDWTVKDVQALARTVYDVRDIGAAIASGSFPTRGMVVIPCSVKSLSSIANSYAADLITRAADVTLKEGRPLVLVVRETPLHLGHLRLMAQATEMGAVIFPPVPAFYARPETLEDVIDGTVGRVLARLGFSNELFAPWRGVQESVSPDSPQHMLAAQTTLTLSTVNADGSPHACDLFFVRSEDERLYFLSDPATRHVENLLREPRVSVTVHGRAHGWQDIRGVQIAGDAGRVNDDAERARALDLYLARYPFVRQWLGSVKELGQHHPAIGIAELYGITPRWMRWIDNVRGFGHKQEWTLR